MTEGDLNTPALVESKWIDVSRLGSGYEEQLDVNAAPCGSPTTHYRHRTRRHTGQPVADWRPGHAPD
jgi:hypothetical protein